MAKAGAGGLTPLRVRAVRAFLEAAGYAAVPGKHQHLVHWLSHPRTRRSTATTGTTLA